MSITARSTPNIALIKYWGNRNNELRLPMNDNLAMTLDMPHVDITVDHADVLSVRSFDVEGKEREMGEKHIARFQKHLDLIKQYLGELGTPNVIPASMDIEVHSHIPPSVGIASSAAVFSCLARAYAELIKGEIPLTKEQMSVIARLGSGSAGRGIHDGYVALEAGEGDAIDSSQGREIASHEHWLLHDIIVVPSQKEKNMGSTEGHATAHTSPNYAKRVEDIQTRRQKECIDAIITRDFEKLQKVAEEDSLDMHINVMQTSTPALYYLNDDTHRIIDEITALRESDHLPVLYTMDAGPTVHLFCTDEARDAVAAFAHAQTNCTVFETKVGPGARIIEDGSEKSTRRADVAAEVR